MHKMTLAESVLQIVEDAARREGLRRIRAVWLEIGQLSSVEPDAALWRGMANNPGSGGA